MKISIWLSVFPIIAFSACSSSSDDNVTQPIETHDALVQFFFEWREFAAPEVNNGVPDYTRAAMTAQHKALPDWQIRLSTADTTGWSISEQIDWYLVWIEMNGLDFAHRVTQPWFNDPAFYVYYFPSPTDVPEREGPNIHGAIELPDYPWPLTADHAANIARQLRNLDPIYQQARHNLTGTGHDLWKTAERSLREQSRDLQMLADKVQPQHPDLADAAREAQNISNTFADWIARQLPEKNDASGIGKDHYTWNLQNVHLLPYSWEQLVSLMKHELARSHTALRMEEHRNRNLPPLTHMQTSEEYDRKFNDAIDEYMSFLEDQAILPIKDYMDAALRARVGQFTPSDGLRSFFSEITYRDPIVMRTHDYHWIDLARLREEPHLNPIRQTPLLHNAFDSRAEGMATGMEEWMMHAGLLDDKPRTRELIWVLLAQRAARALGALYQHGFHMTFDEATAFASKWTPWQLLPADGSTIQGEQQFYLQQPGYGTSYVIGKIAIEHLIAEYARQREGHFVLSEFTDAFNASGIIPVSLIHWELTGDKSMLNEALGIHEPAVY